MDYSLATSTTVARSLHHKIAIIGARNVGKTTLSIRYVESHFVESYYPTISNEFTKLIRYKGQDYTIEILDTAGQDDASVFNTKSLIGLKGVILCYNVMCRETLQMLPMIWERLIDQLELENPIPLIVLGNKIDLRDVRHTAESHDTSNKAVTYQEGEHIISKFKKLGDKPLDATFMECSAKLNLNVDEAIMQLLKQIEIYERTNDKESNCTIA